MTHVQVGWMVPQYDKKRRPVGWYAITHYDPEQLTPRPDGGPRLPDGAVPLYVEEEG